jgi:hypothetical protein
MTEKRFDDRGDYALNGTAMNRLWELSVRLNDGVRIDPDERRDLAQWMQAVLTQMSEKITIAELAPRKERSP